MKIVLVVCAAVLFLSANISSATIIFSDSFSAANGTMLGSYNGWNVTSGDVAIQGGTVDTSLSNTFLINTQAFHTFQTLTAGSILTLNFTTLAPSSGNFFSGGWAGISLFSGANENFFLGNASSPGWALIDYGNTLNNAKVSGVGTNPSNASQAVQFTYSFDTGAWSYNVGGHTLNGTSASGLAINAVRIGADHSNISDINVNNITVSTASASAVPEPGTMMLMGSGVLGMLGFRRKENLLAFFKR